jgi:protein TonB
MQPISQHNQLFSYSECFKRVFIWIFFLHLILGLLAYFGLPNFDFKKRPDLIIELFSLPPSSGGKQSTINQTHSQTKEANRKDLSVDKVGGDIPKDSQSPPIVSASNGIGPANTQSSDVDLKVAYLKNPKPPYPPIAVKMGLEGRVSLLVEVLPGGGVGRVRLESSSGHEPLDQSALETVKNWQFSPAKKDGRIISQVVRIPITFNLKNSQK